MVDENTGGFATEDADENAEYLEPGDEEAISAPATPLWRRVLFGLFVTVAVIFFVGVMLYQFGSMMPPSAETKATYSQLEAQGQVPPIQQQFHIPIPGCKCHATDPVLIVQHSNRRISECMQCHGGGAPGM